jgi:hypothetical protein
MMPESRTKLREIAFQLAIYVVHVILCIGITIGILHIAKSQTPNIGILIVLVLLGIILSYRAIGEYFRLRHLIMSAFRIIWRKHS